MLDLPLPQCLLRKAAFRPLFGVLIFAAIHEIFAAIHKIFAAIHKIFAAIHIFIESLKM